MIPMDLFLLAWVIAIMIVIMLKIYPITMVRSFELKIMVIFQKIIHLYQRQMLSQRFGHMDIEISKV